ncbi:MAG: hypothetical protein QGG09_08995 [Pirellulaceae bacterium]|jgi:hypothetical protein|nr:hypothetical protein [Pirellulaceae bacterium]HJN12684.1 hypothetical protein [Pirellulaceae bacterium]
MSRKVWLRPNRRVFVAGIIILGLSLAGTIPLIATSQHVAVTTVGWMMGVLTLLLVFFAVRTIMRPRLAYDGGFLLVYLGSVQPHRVPIELVECFFLGQAPSLLPAPTLTGESNSPESATIVVRLAESAVDWKQVEVKPSLGLWRDGYITIRGTWCEPINADCMKQLNNRLVETHRQQRKVQERETA